MILEASGPTAQCSKTKNSHTGSSGYYGVIFNFPNFLFLKGKY